MTKHFTSIVFLIAITLCSFAIGQQIDLSGTWQADLLDINQSGPATLPGSLCSNKLGTPRTKTLNGSLSSAYAYIGPAVYTREFEIPADMADQDLELFLERVNWVSTVMLDGVDTNSKQTTLLTPHVHPLGKLSVGKHTISVTVDNSEYVNLLKDGHTYGESMMSIWNGIIGQIAIRVRPTLRNVQIDAPYPSKSFTVTADCDTNLADCAFTMKDATGKEMPLKVASCELRVARKDSVTNERQQVVCSFDQPVQPWSEFNPYLYQISIQSKANPKGVYTWSIGFRTISREKNQIFLNGKRIYIRGNLDCGNFPYTGYPDMDKASWLKRLKIQKDYGCNTVRFHTWCPPQAAFDAADELGMYLAPETEFWHAGWQKGSTGVGKGDSALDAFIRHSFMDIQETYGNSPSFLFMTIGNELDNSNFNTMAQWIHESKQTDRRHLYSESTTGFHLTAETEFHVTAYYPGIGTVRQQMYPYTDWDYESLYSRTALPTISHEVGQWVVYPSWSELEKYTGCIRPMNLEEQRADAQKMNVTKYNEEFHAASAQNNAIRYKDEIESFMRTPSSQGVHLLSMQDYSGQGEALIGWLDVFWDNKGFMPAERVQGFFAPTTAMARLKKYVYKSNETLTAPIVIHHFALEDLKNETLIWKLDGTKLSGEIALKNVTNGTDTTVGELAVKLNEKEVFADVNTDNRKVARLELVLSSKNGSFKENRYPIWVVNQSVLLNVPDDMVITSDVQTALKALQDGKRVLFNGSRVSLKKNVRRSQWATVYWSMTWFRGQDKTLGCWFDNDVFGQIVPTGFMDWFFYSLVEDSRYVVLDEMPDFRPYAMPVPDWHIGYNNRFGAVFTVQCYKGTLVFCGFDFQDQTPEADALQWTLVHNPTVWKPQMKVFPKWLEDTLQTPKVTIPECPPEYKNAAVLIYAGTKITQMKSDVPWKSRNDAIIRLNDGFGYSLNVSAVWKDEVGSFWIFHSEKNSLKLTSQTSSHGKLILTLCDSNSAGRTGKIICEGKSYPVPVHQTNPDKRVTITIDITRENWLDGEIQVQLVPDKGPNLQLEKVVYMAE